MSIFTNNVTKSYCKFVQRNQSIFGINLCKPIHYDKAFLQGFTHSIYVPLSPEKFAFIREKEFDKKFRGRLFNVYNKDNIIRLVRFDGLAESFNDEVVTYEKIILNVDTKSQVYTFENINIFYTIDQQVSRLLERGRLNSDCFLNHTLMASGNWMYSDYGLLLLGEHYVHENFLFPMCTKDRIKNDLYDVVDIPTMKPPYDTAVPQIRDLERFAMSPFIMLIVHSTSDILWSDADLSSFLQRYDLNLDCECEPFSNLRTYNIHYYQNNCNKFR